MVDLVKALTARKHEVYLAVAPKSPLLKLLATFPRTHLIELPLRNSLDVLSAMKLREFAAEINPNVIHAHLARDYSLAAFSALAHSRTKLVFTRHLTFPLNLLHALTFKRANSVIAVSNGVRRALENQKFISHKKIKLVLNGIDIKKFANTKADSLKIMQTRRAWNSNAQSFVGIVGELRPHKGVELFLRAAKQVVLQNETVSFVVAGIDLTPNQIHLRTLQKFVIENGLSHHVRFLGWTQSPEQVFAALDIFVSAADVEPFGLVIAEAMASGLAVISTNTDGAKDLVRHNETGLIINIGDEAALVAAITKLIEQPFLREKLGRQAQAFAFQHLSLARMIDETLAVYQF